MIDTDRYEGHTEGPWDYEIPETGDNIIIDSEGAFVAQVSNREDTKNAQLIADAPLLLEEVKRLREENKILAKYMEIVQKYDDALLADGDTDPRWSELYD